MTSPAGVQSPAPEQPGGPSRWVSTAQRRRALVAIGATVLVLLALLRWGVTDSAFLATRSTGSNSFTSGVVSFDTNTPAGAMFTVASAKPGSTGTTCVKITYTGNLASQVKLYVAAGGLTGSGLGSYLTLQINEGSGNATGGSCSDFVSTGTPYNTTGLSDSSKTVAAFAAASTNFATGVSSWSATTGASKTYQFIWRLQPLNAAAGKTVGVTFTWEAQST